MSVRTSILCVFVFLVNFCPTKASALPSTWARIPTGLDETNLRLIAVSNPDPNFFLLGSDSNVYRSLDGGTSWKQVFNIPKTEAALQRLAVHPLNVNYVYLLTSDGLYMSANQGAEWYPCYLGLKEGTRDARAISFHPRDRSQILLGTGSGLFISHDWGRNWQSIFPLLSAEEIRDVYFDYSGKGTAFALTKDTIYRLDLSKQETIELFEIPSIADENESVELEDSFTQISDETDKMLEGFRRLTLAEPKHIFVASSEGIYQSRDKGISWEPIRSAGSRAWNVTDFEVSVLDNSLFIASDRGLFQYLTGEDRLHELYKGLPTSHVSDLAVSIDIEEKLFAVTAQGLYQLTRLSGFQPTEVFPDLIPSPNLLDFYGWTEQEPTITEVQRLAEAYANARNGKIRNWQRQSRLSALLPVFSLESKWSIEKNIDIDRGGTNDKDLFITGPDEAELNWSMGFDWDLKRFIWSSDQTSIDSREKLMVELRESLLREVTRIYFERRRLQMEFLTIGEGDFTAKFDRLNRINELAAQIDALTGQHLANRWSAPENYLRFADENTYQEISASEV